MCMCLTLCADPYPPCLLPPSLPPSLPSFPSIMKEATQPRSNREIEADLHNKEIEENITTLTIPPSLPPSLPPFLLQAS